MELNCLLPSNFNKDSRCLLVIAHPDDEALFFSPFLLRCKSIRCSVFILCLSEGNFYGYGRIRRKEILQSASMYGIESSQVQVINDSNLQDGPSNFWSPENVSIYVSKAIDYLKPTIVLTFDEYGVSGHKNHIDTCRGVKYAIAQRIKKQQQSKSPSNSKLNINQQNGNNVICLLLESTTILRKFSGLFDIFLSCFLSNIVVINLNIIVVFIALFLHTSQLASYRFLFILFSRYTYINSFKQFDYLTAISQFSNERCCQQTTSM